MIQLIHEIWDVNDETGFPLVRHTFFGRDEDEALSRYQDHASRDGNLQECFNGDPSSARALVTIGGRRIVCVIRWRFASTIEAPPQAQPEMVVDISPPRRGFMPRMVRGGRTGAPTARVGQMPMPIPEPVSAPFVPQAREPEHMECDGDVCRVVPGKRKGG